MSRFISDTKSCNWNSEKPQKASTSPLCRSTHEESGKLIHTQTPTDPDPRVISQGKFPSPSEPAVLRGNLGICHCKRQRREIPPDWLSTEFTFTSTHTVLPLRRPGNFRQGQRTQFLLFPNLLLSNRNLPIPCSHHVSPMTWHGPHTSPRLTSADCQPGCVASGLYNPQLLLKLPPHHSATYWLETPDAFSESLTSSVQNLQNPSKSGRWSNLPIKRVYNSIKLADPEFSSLPWYQSHTNRVGVKKEGRVRVNAH